MNNKGIAKKLLNRSSHCVPDAIQGILLLNPNLSVLQDENVVVRSDILDHKINHVTLLSGRHMT
jgi:hypothetical protein